jgi:hypothetical protein
MVLSKVGDSGVVASASISSIWDFIAMSKAGRKCSGRTAAKGGRP